MKNNYNWNLKEIFENEEKFENATQELYKLIKKLENYKGKLEESVDNIYEFHKIYEKAMELFEKIYAYGMMTYHQDMSEDTSIRLYKRVEKISTDFSTSISFKSPEISKIDNSVLKEYLKDKRMKPYEKNIKDIIKEKRHILSEEIEGILSQYSEVFSTSENAYEVFTNTEFEYPNIKDSNGKELKMSASLYSKYMTDKNEKIRKQAFESMYSLYKKHINSITELYLSRVKAVVISSRIRGYKSSLDAGTYRDDSSVKVYETLINEVNKNLKTNHEYIKLKAKFLKKDKLNMYDVYVNPLNVETKNIEYNEAKNIVLDALSPLGNEYTKMLDYAFKNNWIDVYAKDNKMSGAYSLGIHNVHPFVLLNYINSARDVSTMAHELGHAMHSFYASKSQNIINANYTIMVAEVASTVNEIILANYLINNEKNKKRKAALINEQLDMIRTTLFRQSMFAEFEKDIHEKIESDESLTSEDLNEIYYKLVKKYFGSHVVINDEIKYEWARIPHLYRCFYVYKYSTGITSAIVIASNILAGKSGYVEKYINMLSQGGIKDSLTLLKMVDVDLEKEETYEVAFKYFKDNLKKLEELMKSK